ncbi:MAG: PmoA family protein [Cohnella sp.]|nr:PmoA family protein [Cohnella sp.]
MTSRWKCVENAQTTMVVERETGRTLGGFGSNFYRSWVFPLYTPDGYTVLQEFAYDHPFHNGFFVGQYPVLQDGKPANFWVVPPRRSYTDKVHVAIGRMDAPSMPSAEMIGDKVRFTLASVWRDEAERPVLDEIRTVDFYALGDATVCEMSSRKQASYGSLTFAQTKYGSIGMRVEPRLLSEFGGVVMADGGRKGNAEAVNQQESDFIAYENDIGGGRRCGIFMHAKAGERGPWFVRDYGMAMFNPTMERSIEVEEGGEWEVSLRLVAYDGALTAERVHGFLNGAEI